MRKGMPKQLRKQCTAMMCWCAQKRAGWSALPATLAAVPRPPPSLPSQVRIILARGLPAADWWNGLADPYIRARLVAADAQPLVYRWVALAHACPHTSGRRCRACARQPTAAACLFIFATPRTRTAFGTLSPEYDEFYELGNVPPGSRLEFEVCWGAGGRLGGRRPGRAGDGPANQAPGPVPLTRPRMSCNWATSCCLRRYGIRTC